MIDRDSYSPSDRGYDEFMSDARAFPEAVRRYVAFDAALEPPAAVADMQLLADAAREFGAPIEEDLRAARRLVEMTFAQSGSAPLSVLKPIKATLFDPFDPPEFRSWQTRQ